MNDFIKQIIQDVCYIGATTILGLASFYLKQFLATHKKFIAKQEKVL